MTLQELRASLPTFNEQAKAIVAKAASENRDLTTDETAQIETINKAREARKATIAAMEQIDAEEATASVPRPRVADPVVPTATEQPQPRIEFPRSYGVLRAFKGPKAADNAFASGMWLMGAGGNKQAAAWCQTHGINPQATGSLESVNTAGGYLVPTPLAQAIIDLRLEYGVFRKYAQVWPMSSDTLNIPRRTGGLTAYYVGEQGAGTVSSATWDQVKLVAKKLMVSTKFSNEIAEDAIISMADRLANEIAYALAYAEDLAGFIGDGTSTYGGILGAWKALYLAAGSATTTSAGGVIIAAGNTFAEVTLANIYQVGGLLPSYARQNAKWYCSPTFQSQVIDRLLSALSGNTAMTIVDGIPRTMLNGYPVILTEAMPTSDANSQIPLLFGDLSKAAAFGDRGGIRIASSDSATLNGDSYSVFQTDEVALRGTERFDIVVHDVGTTSAAGPLVGLQMLNS